MKLALIFFIPFLGNYSATCGFMRDFEVLQRIQKKNAPRKAPGRGDGGTVHHGLSTIDDGLVELYWRSREIGKSGLAGFLN